MKRARYRTLPEDTDYRDTGCELAPACLACPFDRCQFDVDKRKFSRVPTAAVLEARKAGVRREDQAKFYGVSPRHISRILAKAKVSRAGGRSMLTRNRTGGG